jgi:hypothetical protein
MWSKVATKPAGGPTPDVWRGTVQLLLGCPGLDARDQDALRRVLGWHRLGRVEEVWLGVLAERHLGEGVADLGGRPCRKIVPDR